ncbi:MAG: hypothetical protein ACI4RA_10565 [Kiritimatiellia bacterium]
MNVKSLTVACTAIAILSAYTVLAQPAHGARRRPASATKPSGGLVVADSAGRHICLLNTSRLVTAADLEMASRPILMDVRCPFVVVEAKGPEPLADKVARAQRNPKVAFVVPFVDDADDEMLRYRPEHDMCIVNVKALVADGAGSNRLAARLRKQTWRAVGLMLGAGDAPTGHTVLRKAATLEQLDANDARSPSPGQHNQMVSGLKPYGIEMVRVGTYRTACQQGWAPTPTNDAQRAIWDETHRIPATPLKIEFDPKRGR